jgi:hypothetical protein
MHRLVIATAIVVMGCGAEDDRSRNLDYITEAVLKPNCGSAVCHSSFRQAKGYVFDTIDAARASFQRDEILMLPSDPEQRDSVAGLVVNLTTELPKAPRMPYYEPLPDADVELIRHWLHDGAAGTCTGSASCLGPFIVPCTADHGFNIDLVVPTVDAGQVTDCADLGAKMTPVKVMTCRDTACVEVPQ